jgi:hypothetical protein
MDAFSKRGHGQVNFIIAGASACFKIGELTIYSLALTISKTIVLETKGQAMTIDFQQVRQQVQQFGETAETRQQAQLEARALAAELFHEYAKDVDALRYKVRQARQHDPTLRCAQPPDAALGVVEAPDGCFPLPSVPSEATILAADGSQIIPDRHSEVQYGLINVGAILMRLGSANAPQTTVSSTLITGDDLYASSGSPRSEAALALQRDLSERQMLSDLARGATPPVISFTDGPMELWGAKEGDELAEYKDSLEKYRQTLESLHQQQVATAGFVDKPAANLVVRLLEVALCPQDELVRIKDFHPLRGVSDLGLFQPLLEPGDRSAVFAIQSKSASNYPGPLALHFFYLNVGRAGHPHLARVEITAWVAEQAGLLDPLHAVLVGQSRLMGARPYPYLLHRAHEAALVSLDEKSQVTQMIVLELRRRGLEVGEISYKQSAKNLAPRTRYKS